MKNNSYFDSDFHSNYGLRYTAYGAMLNYLSETTAKINTIVAGTILGTLMNRLRACADRQQTIFKMGDSGFRNNINLNQTIKHGAILYIVIALLAVPAGICSTQHLSFHFEPPLVIRAPSSSEIHKELESLTFKMTAASLSREIARMDAEAALAAAPPFYQHITKAAQAYEVDAALIRAIIMAESSNNPKAVSHRGAQGLMQLMPITARSLGIADVFNPELNIDGGVRYFKSLLDRFNGNVELALAAYNAGSRYVHKYGGVPPFRATRVYIKKVLQYRQEYQNEMVSSGANLSAV